MSSRLKWGAFALVAVGLLACDFIHGAEHIAVGIAILGLFLILMSGDLDNHRSRDGIVLKVGLCVLPLLAVASQPEQQNHPGQQLVAIGLAALMLGLSFWYAWSLGGDDGDDGDDFGQPEDPNPGSGIDWDVFDRDRSSWEKTSV